MKKDSKIYVTGSSGMVGKNLIMELNKKGYKNLIYKSLKELDLRNRKNVFDFFKKEEPEYVFHMAAKVGGIKANIDNPVEFLRDNLLLNTNIIDACFEFKINKLINLGSSCIYPKNIKQPMGEEDLMSDKLEPTNEGYALSKICSLKLCKYYNEQYKTNFISLIPPNIYGEYDHFELEKSHVISSLITKFHNAKKNNLNKIEIWGTGGVKREFLYVKDLVKIIIFSMKNLKVRNLYSNCFINCGSGKEISIKELSYLVKELTSFKGKIIFDKTKPEGMRRKLMNSDRFNRIYKKNIINIQNGLKNTYKFFLDQS